MHEAIERVEHALGEVEDEERAHDAAEPRMDAGLVHGVAGDVGATVVASLKRALRAFGEKGDVPLEEAALPRSFFPARGVAFPKVSIMSCSRANCVWTRNVLSSILFPRVEICAAMRLSIAIIIA